MLLVGTALVILCAARATSARSRSGPGFDCRKATTQVERAICNDGDGSLGWMDGTMDRLYSAVHQAAGVRAPAVQAGQRTWLAQRDRCRGGDAALSACLSARYQQRFAVLTAAYDAAHVTGAYRASSIDGLLRSVLFPDHMLAVEATSDSGPPSYSSCGLTLVAPLDHDRLDYEPPPGDYGGGTCRFTLTVSKTGIGVVQTGCDGFCGHAAQIAGTYRRE